jgi:hypothetical protein
MLRVEPALEELVGDAGELALAHAGVAGVGLDDQGKHRHLGRVELLDDGFLDGVRQVAPDLADLGADILQGLVDGALQLELDGQGAQALLAGGADLPHLLDGVDRLLDLLDHVLLHRVGAGAGVDHADRDHGHVDLGKAVQAEPLDGEQAQHDQRQHDHGREDRVLQADAGEPHGATFAPARTSPRCLRAAAPWRRR